MPEERYIPKGFRQKSPFFITIEDDQYAFPEEFYVKSPMTDEEQKTLHQALERHHSFSSSLDYEKIKLIAANPSMYDSEGNPVPAVPAYDPSIAENARRVMENDLKPLIDAVVEANTRKAMDLVMKGGIIPLGEYEYRQGIEMTSNDPNVEWVFGKYNIAQKLKMLSDAGYEAGDLALPEDTEVLQLDYRKLKKRDIHEKPNLDAARKIQEEQDQKIMGDNINHPSHYTQYKGVEVIDITEQLNFNRGNAVKYIARAGFKSEDTEVQDLEKAKWYVNREIDRIFENVPKYRSTADATLLVEQMSYNRGSAVAAIAHAGTSRPEDTISDLYTAVNHIDRELFRLSQHKED